MKYLLDTCVISDLFKKIPNVLKHFESVAPAELAISTLTIMEIEYGLKINPDKEIKIRPVWINFLKQIHLIAYSPQCAISTGVLRGKLKTAGIPIGPYDILIAGTAMAHQLCIVTSNEKEFICLPEIPVKNWRS